MKFAPAHVLSALVALCLALPALWIDTTMFFACWLVAWWYLIGLALGICANTAIHVLTGGRWGSAMQAAHALTAWRVPLLLVFALPLAASMWRLYPWMADPTGGWASGLPRPAFVMFWMSPAKFEMRALFYAAAWLWMSRPGALATSRRAAMVLVLYALSTTLASVDLLMSLVPGWFSTAFGLVVMSGQALGGCALAVLVACMRSRHAIEEPNASDRSRKHPPIWRDYGNLLLMWVMLWAYLAYMEFLIIWAEDLPREIAWFLPRLRTAWAYVGTALAILQLVIPFLALLQRRLKDRPQWLACIAALLLATQLLNTAWLVLPSVSGQHLYGWWLVPLLTLAMSLPLMGGASLAKRMFCKFRRKSTEVGHASP